MRNESIKSKLDHVSYNIQNLGDVLFDGKVKNKKIENISHLVGDTLSNTTECFDYCVKDIFEEFIFPKNSKLNGHKVSFPFYLNQLEKEPFLSLKTYNFELYKYLENLVRKFDSEELIPQTMLKYSIARHIRNLVNDKKHDDVIEIDSKGSPELVSSFGGIKMILPLKQFGIINKEIDHDSMGDGPMIIANGYELKETGEEVMMLCQFAKSVTSIILEDLYKENFNKSISFI